MIPHAARGATGLALLLLAGCGAPADDARPAAQAPAGVPAPTVTTGEPGAGRIAMAVEDTAVPTPIAASLSKRGGIRRRPPALSAGAESLATHMTFVPRTQTWFVVAARGRRLLVDVGRVDVEVRRDSLRRAAFREAADRLSPLPAGALVRLRGPWGTEDATVTGFDVWNGRIVATVRTSAALDSLARRRDPLVGAALRLTGADSAAAVAAESLAVARVAGDSSAATGTDSTGPRGTAAGSSPATIGGPPPTTTIASAAPARTTVGTPGASSRPALAGSDSAPVIAAGDGLAAGACVRDSVPATLLERAELVRDSLEVELRTTAMPAHARLQKSVTVSASHAPGCYGPLGRMLLVVSLRAGANEYVRERLVALDDSGRVAPLRVSDYRFKAHDALYAFDADGDGVDDLAARGIGQRSGATVVLRLDPSSRRAARLAGGFAWEAR